MQEILNALVGKTFIYKTKTISISKWKKVATTYVIFTDKQTYNFFESELKIFTHELRLVRGLENRQLEIKKASIKVNEYQLKTMETEQQEVKIVPIQEDLKNVLFDTIQKLQTDKSYIQQANAICNVVSQMINIKKLELLIKNKQL